MLAAVRYAVQRGETIAKEKGDPFKLDSSCSSAKVDLTR
jgi:hypothetical protein